MKYRKPAFTVNEQIAHLREKGLDVANEQALRIALAQIGYYRLRGYMHPFRDRSEPKAFKSGVDSDTILRHYAFDKSLRIIVLQSIETIEIALRASIADITSLELGTHWYTEEANFYDRSRFDELMDFVRKNVQESTEEYLHNYRSKYPLSPNPPIWITMEFMTLGKLSNLFENMKDNDAKKRVGLSWKLPTTILISWLKSLNFLRNCCAHHSRVWNRRLPLKPMLPQRDKYRVLQMIEPDTDKCVFGVLSCMLYLLRSLGKDQELRSSIHDLLNEYPDVNHSYMGFHSKWREEPIWQLG